MKWMLFLGLILGGISSYSQQSKYFVFLTSGEVWIKSPGHVAAKAKPKQILGSKDIIELRNENSEVAIANVSGYYYVIREKGPHGMDEIHKMEKSRPTGITPKFLSYLYEDMIHPKAGKVNREAIAASWGAGSRGNECITMKSPGDDLISSMDTIVFKWAANTKKPAYRFILFDHDEVEKFSCVVRDTQIIISAVPLRKGDAEKYSWAVDAVANPCPIMIKRHFEVVSVEEERKRVGKIIKDIPKKENQILFDLAIADALGLNGFYDRAIEYYEKARAAINN